MYTLTLRGGNLSATRVALAEMFLHAGDADRTGRAAITFDDPMRAASFFERSHMFSKAAILYEHAGRKQDAVRHLAIFRRLAPPR